jgi:hypothetical protein
MIRSLGPMHAERKFKAEASKLVILFGPVHAGAHMCDRVWPGRTCSDACTCLALGGSHQHATHRLASLAMIVGPLTSTREIKQYLGLLSKVQQVLN